MKNSKFIKSSAPFKALALFGLLLALIFAGCNKDVDDDFGAGEPSVDDDFGAGEPSTGKLETPTASPETGDVPSGTEITLYSPTDPDALIYYTVDKGDPDAGEPEMKQYSDSEKPVITGEEGEKTIIKVYAVKEGKDGAKETSEVGTFEYKISNNVISPPVASPSPGQVDPGTQVTLLTTTEGATIYYTTDDINPTKDSTPYSGPITIKETTSIRAIAIKDGMIDSNVAKFAYYILVKPETAEALPALKGNISVEGTANVGHTLTALTSALEWDTTGTISYQWKVAGIEKGTGTAYTVQAVDFHNPITLTVSASKNSGSITETATNSALGVPLNELLDPYLNNLSPGSTAEAPYTVPLAACSISENWGTISRDVDTAGSYVILDLSDCTAAGNTITGDETNPANNDFNILKGNSYLKGIILPSTLTSIGDYVLRDCMHVTSISIPEGVTSIGKYAFYRCVIEDFNLPSSLTSIGEDAFASCPELASITIPGSVSAIGEDAFAGCENLTTVVFAEGSSIASFGSNAFPQGNDGDGGDALKTAYNAASNKAGTYTRPPSGSVWEKQP